MNIGFIGLGQMGVGMASNLIKAGHQITVYNRSPGKAEPLVAQGAKQAGSVAEACGAPVVVTMLADDGALEAVAFGPDGVLARLPKGALHISCSTISVALSDRLTAAHGAAGQAFVAAPVFGRPPAAAAAELVVVAAGKPEALKTAKPLFDAVGRVTYEVGETPSAANLIKLSGNFLIACAIESMGEAMALVAKGGVDRAQFHEILTSTIFNASVYKNYGSMIAKGVFEPAGFPAPLGLKDLRLAQGAADALQVPLPIAGLLRDRYLTLLAHGGDHLDWGAIGGLAAKDAAVK